MSDVIHRIEKFPQELSSAIKGLDSENRRAILLSLYFTPKMAFSDILEETKLGDSLLSSHLRVLQDSFLVVQFYEHELGREEYSFYELTKFGRRIITSLLGTYYQIEEDAPIELTPEIEPLAALPGRPVRSGEKGRNDPGH